MRVNVLHPIFLTDQHLVAEYREVKMGPKALSRSLYSKNGVNKNKISPVYTLNTGHTYFFYDKNKFLERRLGIIIKEMQLRGFQTNHINLIDDSYNYHEDTFNEEWWNDWQPDEYALNINRKRIWKRVDEKIGWYKFWGRPILDMDELISTRAQNSFWGCPSCNAIHEFYDSVCWNCGKTLPKDLVKTNYV